ncbi:MAG: VCBS repeat-containing protein [Bryobacteraceae bacterium]
MYLLIAFLLSGAAVNSLPTFREHVIANDLKGGYQVAAVDLTGDGRSDLIALASGMSELAWYENPGWNRHVIATGLSSPINVAASDAQRGRTPELVLATGFSMYPAKSTGEVWSLRHQGDPRKPWSITQIDRLPTSHRLRWADLDGSGKKVVINAPLAGADATAPDYRSKTPLVFYQPGKWKRELISDETEGVMHGFTTIDWDGDGREEILTASFQGIHLFQRDAGGRWSRTELAKGCPEAWPKSGSSDIAVGKLAGRRFLCSIEPWHGNQLAVYLQQGNKWNRHVIDDTLVEGHALAAADLDGDGMDEILGGFRGSGHSISIYKAASSDGTRWERHVLDTEIPASSCVVVDLNGDGRPDIACIGGSVLKWYENLGK